MVGRWLRP